MRPVWTRRPVPLRELWGAYLALWVAFYGAGSALAAEPAAGNPSRGDGRSIDMVFAEVPPIIDGVPDEAIWEIAPLLEPLIQVEPIEGAAPSQKTEARVLFDENFHDRVSVTTSL